MTEPGWVARSACSPNPHTYLHLGLWGTSVTRSELECEFRESRNSLLFVSESTRHKALHDIGTETFAKLSRSMSRREMYRGLCLAL